MRYLKHKNGEVIDLMDIYIRNGGIGTNKVSLPVMCDEGFEEIIITRPLIDDFECMDDILNKNELETILFALLATRQLELPLKSRNNIHDAKMKIIGLMKGGYNAKRTTASNS